MEDAQIDRMIRDFAQRLQYQGMNLDAYLHYTGSNLDKMREDFRENANKQTKTMLVLEAVCNAEKVEASDDEVEAKIEDMAKAYNMEIEKLKELISADEKENLANDIKMQKTVDLLVDKASIK